MTWETVGIVLALAFGMALCAIAGVDIETAARGILRAVLRQ